MSEWAVRDHKGRIWPNEQSAVEGGINEYEARLLAGTGGDVLYRASSSDEWTVVGGE